MKKYMTLIDKNNLVLASFEGGFYFASYKTSRQILHKDITCIMSDDEPIFESAGKNIIKYYPDSQGKKNEKS